MKRLYLAGLVLVSATSATVTNAQNLYIDWFTIDGGSGTSTGGLYAVSGTIGQADAGMMSGGQYSLTGGFWNVLSAVQTPGVPLLRVERTSTNTVVVAWPATSIGFDLEQNSRLGTTNWSSVAMPPITIGAEKQVVVPAPVGNQFYRLRKP